MPDSPSTAGTHEALRLRMPLGPDWFRLSLGAQPDLAQLAAQVDERIGRETRLLDSRQKLIDMLVYFSGQATQRGAAIGALRWAQHELDVVSVATLYVSYHPDNHFGDTDRLLSFLQDAAAPRHGSDKTEPSVDLRDLPAGRVVRVQVISDPGFEPPSSGEPVPDEETGLRRRALLQETVQYWLPVPGDDVVVLLSFSTPNLAAAEALVAELDRMVEDLRIIR